MNLSPEKLEHYFNELKKYDPLFEHYKDQSRAQVSLRFCISHLACQTVIPGAKTALQVQENSMTSDLGPIPENEIKSFVQNN
jgi:aryl-alcohol dehydrogenase-like predicted oxidoreductase